MNKFASLGAECGREVMRKVAAGEWAMPGAQYQFDPHKQDLRVADAMRHQERMAQQAAQASQMAAPATQAAPATPATPATGAPNTPKPPTGEGVPTKKGFFSGVKGKLGLAMGAATIGVPMVSMLWNKFSGKEPTMEQQGYAGAQYF